MPGRALWRAAVPDGRRASQPGTATDTALDSRQRRAKLREEALVQRRVRFGWPLAAAAVLAGCGGGGGSSSTDQTATFKTALTPVVDQLRETAKGIGAEIQQAPSQSDAQIGSSFSQLASRWQQQLSQLETLRPPAKIGAEFHSLADAAGRVEADLTAIVAAAHTHSKSAAEQAAASLVTDVLSAKAASTKVTDQLGIK
jgi:hypothetical protein